MLAGGILLLIPSYLVSFIGLVVGGAALLLAWLPGRKKTSAQ